MSSLPCPSSIRDIDLETVIMIKTILLVFATLFSISGAVFDLPPYMPRCSLSDPNFSHCLVNAANKVIPIIAKGDASLDISPVSPITYAEAPVRGNGLYYILYDVYTDDIKNIRFTDMLMDFENGKTSFKAVIDKVESIMQNYTVVEGKVLDIPVYGHGKHNFTMVGLKIHYQGAIRFYEKAGDRYLDYFDTSADVNLEKVYFYFENIKSPEKDDVNSYIEENSMELYNQMKPAIDEYFDLFVNSRIKTIVNAVPFDKIFLP